MFTGVIIWFRSMSTNCIGVGFNGLCYKQIFMKLFCTNVMDTVKIWQDYFNFELPSSIIEKRRKTFVACCVDTS